MKVGKVKGTGVEREKLTVWGTGIFGNMQFLHLLPCCSECSVKDFELIICNYFFNIHWILQQRVPIIEDGQLFLSKHWPKKLLYSQRVAVIGMIILGTTPWTEMIYDFLGTYILPKILPFFYSSEKIFFLGLSDHPGLTQSAFIAKNEE